ncbi:hypothetical protein K439DRAFT_1625662 [Ramaria rubella]|nr:hypothetical protein K439DRAFT_1625662 [Ramaria rubella]
MYVFYGREGSWIDLGERLDTSSVYTICNDIVVSLNANHPAHGQLSLLHSYTLRSDSVHRYLHKRIMTSPARTSQSIVTTRLSSLILSTRNQLQMVDHIILADMRVQASPSNSNGNEQAHCNINRDGIKLTMLAGIMRGMQYDSRPMSGLELLRTYGISSRDRQQTPDAHHDMSHCSEQYVGAVQKRAIQAHDVEQQAAYKQLVGLQHKSLKRALKKEKGVE